MSEFALNAFLSGAELGGVIWIAGALAGGFITMTARFLRGVS